PDRPQVVGDEPRAEPRERALLQRIAVAEAPVDAAAGISGPDRRTQALDPPAFLVDEDGRIPADRRAQGIAKRPHLSGHGDIALEEDEAPRPRLFEEGGLTGGEGEAGAAGDEGAGGHVRALRPPEARVKPTLQKVSSSPRNTGRPVPGRRSRAERRRSWTWG